MELPVNHGPAGAAPVARGHARPPSVSARPHPGPSRRRPLGLSGHAGSAGLGRANAQRAQQRRSAQPMRALDAVARAPSVRSNQACRPASPKAPVDDVVIVHDEDAQRPVVVGVSAATGVASGTWFTGVPPIMAKLPREPRALAPTGRLPPERGRASRPVKARDFLPAGKRWAQPRARSAASSRAAPFCSSVIPPG